METLHFDCISYVRAEGIYTLDFCPVWTIPDKISTKKELPLSVRHGTRHRSDLLSERGNAVLCCTSVNSSKSTFLDNFISKFTSLCYINVPLSDPCFVIGTTSSPAVAAKGVAGTNTAARCRRSSVVKTSTCR